MFHGGRWLLRVWLVFLDRADLLDCGRNSAATFPTFWKVAHVGGCSLPESLGTSSWYQCIAFVPIGRSVRRDSALVGFSLAGQLLRLRAIDRRRENEASGWDTLMAK